MRSHGPGSPTPRGEAATRLYGRSVESRSKRIDRVEISGTTEQNSVLLSADHSHKVKAIYWVHEQASDWNQNSANSDIIPAFILSPNKIPRMIPKRTAAPTTLKAVLGGP
jgi:hypothetical protein